MWLTAVSVTRNWEIITLYTSIWTWLITRETYFLHDSFCVIPPLQHAWDLATLCIYIVTHDAVHVCFSSVNKVLCTLIVKCYPPHYYQYWHVLHENLNYSFLVPTFRQCLMFNHFQTLNRLQKGHLYIKSIELWGPNYTLV